MSLISDIIHNTLLLEDVATNRVYDAIKNTYEVEINYRSNGEDIANGKRIIQPVAYGLTKAGNPVIRAFQPYGDTTTKVPSWKFFRLDRITSWTPFPDRTFPEPPAEYNADGEYNKTGDKTMSIMYSNANFGNKPIANSLNTQKNGPSLVKKDEPEVYKTETEKGIERLRKQLENPRYISDLVKKRNFSDNKDNNTAPIGSDE